jgi:PEP-CTERM motif
MRGHYSLRVITMFVATVIVPTVDAVAITWTNGHTYQVVLLDNPTWFEARDLAAAMTLSGSPGYLATFTTRDEQEFVINNLGGGPALNALWLGGYQDVTDPGYSEPDGGWKWITGEPWLGVAANDPLVPRSDFGFNNAYFDLISTEEHLITWFQTGGFNDYYHTPSDVLGDANGGPARGFIVEFNVPEPATAMLLLGFSLIVTSGRRVGV